MIVMSKNYNESSIFKFCDHHQPILSIYLSFPDLILSFELLRPTFFLLAEKKSIMF